jgi:uncharacterized repeat protein (TIGR03803 family)
MWHFYLRKTAYAVFLFSTTIIVPQSAQAQKLIVLYTFTGGTDGAFPDGLIRDSAGTFYGTTAQGVGCGGFGCGTVFKLRGKKKTLLHNFTGKSDGSGPEGILLDHEGVLSGTTTFGGKCSDCGAIYTLNSRTKKIVVQYRFSKAGGTGPNGGLVRDADGNLYGTNKFGGTNGCRGAGGCGTVFRLDSTGKESTLYKFKGGHDGAYPRVGLVRDGAGNLYGTTEQGGDLTCVFDPPPNGCGVVFKINKAGKETVLHRFTGSDGEDPGDIGVGASLVRDADGNLYGTTPFGGSGAGICGLDSSQPCGTVYKLDTSGKLTVLFNFTGQEDGGIPTSALVRDSKGNLYGTTSIGGATGYGTVFKLDNAGQHTVLYNFTGGMDGQEPDGLIRDSAGNLYGVTAGGGDANCDGGFGCGTVFKLAH